MVEHGSGVKRVSFDLIELSEDKAITSEIREILESANCPIENPIEFSSLWIKKIPDRTKVDQEFNSGADNGIRTRDPRLGKPMLYQLSYVRKVLTKNIIKRTFLFDKARKPLRIFPS